jgi:rhodanese-related sulfurtransferase
MKSYADLVADAKKHIKEVTPEQVMREREAGGKVVLIDIRDREEVNLGMIPGAAHISRGNLESGMERSVPRDAHVVLYCAAGNRSALAAETLEKMGYTDVSSMSGGFRAWAEQGGDVD